MNCSRNPVPDCTSPAHVCLVTKTNARIFRNFVMFREAVVVLWLLNFRALEPAQVVLKSCDLLSSPLSCCLVLVAMVFLHCLCLVSFHRGALKIAQFSTFFLCSSFLGICLEISFVVLRAWLLRSMDNRLVFALELLVKRVMLEAMVMSLSSLFLRISMSEKISVGCGVNDGA